MALVRFSKTKRVVVKFLDWVDRSIRVRFDTILLSQYPIHMSPKATPREREEERAEERNDRFVAWVMHWSVRVAIVVIEL